MTPEKRALVILGKMDITPGRGREREDNWLLLIADELRAALAAQREADANIADRLKYIADRLELDRPHMQEGREKDAWENGVADASIAIAAAIRAGQ